MIWRLAVAGVVLFWIVMNVLLWRSEFGHRQIGASVPVAHVVDKILTAPDASTFTIRHQGKDIGWARWHVQVETEAVEPVADFEEIPEGMVTAPSHYLVELEGNVFIKPLEQSLRFDCVLKVSTNEVVQSMQMRLNLKPFHWEVHADPAKNRVRVQSNFSGDEVREFTFDDLKNPEKLLRQADPSNWMLPVLTQMIPANVRNASSNPSLGIKWEARQDSVNFGSSPLKVYRLETHLLDRYNLVVLVERFGAVLRVELPNGTVFDGMSTLLTSP